jgi:predicted RNA-binding Zn-ribbon protein involved in translation (DUF1610 family)
MFKNFFKNIKNNMFKINNKEPLSKMSLMVILFLDVFLLINLFGGLNQHLNQLTKPNEYISSNCNNFFNNDKKIENLENYFNQKYYKNKLDYFSTSQSLSECQKLKTEIKTLINNNELKSFFKQKENSEKEITKLNNKIESLKNSYPNLLLEKIANLDENLSITESKAEEIKKDLKILEEQKEKEKEKIILLTKNIKNHQNYKNFFSFINENKEKVNNADNIYKYWYPVKRLLLEFLFLLPLLFLVYWWNQKSLKKEKNISILISAHLLFIISVPILFSILKLIWEIIPRKILQNLWNYLMQSNLILIWHYLLYFIYIAVAFLIVYLIQKKLFSYEKLVEKRISQQECFYCGKKQEKINKHCPYCGKDLLKKCSNCQELTFTETPFCRNCGKKQ